MEIQDWINKQKKKPIQDRNDGKDYWRTDNLYTEADLIELLEAFALYNVAGESEHFNCLGVNYAKGIKPCFKWCGEDMCQKPIN